MHLRTKWKRLKSIFNKRYILYYCGIVAIILTTLLMSSQLVVQYSTKDTGTAKLFYGNGDQEEPFDEEQYIQKRILRTDNNVDKVYFKVPFWNMNDIKLNFTGINKIEIQHMYVSSMGIKTADLLKQIQNGKFEFEQSKISNGEAITLDINGINNKVTGTTLGIVFPALLICIKASIFLAIIGWIILLLWLKISKEFSKERMSVAFFSILILFCMMLVGFQMIEQKQVEESTIVYDNQYNKNPKLEKYKISFKAVKEKAYSLIVENILYEEASGSLRYILSDKETGRTLLKQSTQASNIIRNGSLELDLSDVELIRGHEYIVQLDISNRENYFFPQYKKGELQATVLYSFDYKKLADGILVGVFLLSILFMICLKKYHNIKKFVILECVIGIMLVFLIPPFSGSDEIRHFLRSYSLSQNNENVIQTKEYVGSGDGKEADAAEIPMQISDLRLVDDGYDYDNISYQAERSEKINWSRLKNMIEMPDTETKDLVSLWGVMGIHFICYIPQIIMIFLWNILKLPEIGVLYAARMANMLFCIALSFISIRIIPEKYKKAAVATCFIPGLLVIQSSCSLDGIVVGAVRLFVCYVLYLEEKEVDIHWKQLVILVGLLGYIALLKIPYILVCFTIFLLKRTNFRTIEKMCKKLYRDKLSLTALILAGGSVTLLFGSKLSAMLMRGGSSLLGSDHIEYMIQYPIQFLKSAWTFIVADTIPYIVKGASYNNNMLLGVACVIVLMLCCVRKTEKPHIGKKFVILLATAFSMIAAMFAVGFSLSTPGAKELTEIAGRYYLPILTIIVINGWYVGTKFKREYAVIEEMLVTLSMATVIYLFYIFWI